MKNTKRLIIASVLILISQYSNKAFAAGSAGHFMGIGLSSISASQSDLNNITSTINTTQGGVSTGAMNSAYDFFVEYGYKFSGPWAIVFRPSYFTASTSGSGNTVGSYSHSLTGYTIFPMARVIPLENNFIKFFLQAGVGYGSLSGKTKQGTALELGYSGSAFGAIGGIGANFCFTPRHCMTIEGDLRYLPIARNIANNVTGTFTAAGTGFSQATSGSEVEYNNSDMSTTMSGVQGVIAYMFNF